ncbi:MAG: Gfo/Idh/MocA family oxidoreductase [Patescibacteria group bacterium]
MREVKFVIIGAGKIGTRHAAKLKDVEGARFVGVYDIAPERKEKLAKEHGARAYGTLDELLQDTEVDVVNICTPSGLHPEHAIRALQAGRHVLSEKPMAFREADARRMIEAAKQSGRMLFVVKQNRYNPPVKLVEKLLREGVLGKPIQCVVNMFWNRNEEYYTSDAWRGTKHLDGGTLYTQASHFVDLMIALMGKPKWVFAAMGTYKQNIETEDTGIIMTEFESGALGVVNYTTCATNKNFEGSITFIGTKGTIKIGGEYLNTIDYFEVEGMDSYELEGADAGANDYGSYRGSMSNHDKVFQDVVAKVRNPEINGLLVSGEGAVGGVRFMEKAFESAKKGEKVFL